MSGTTFRFVPTYYVERQNTFLCDTFICPLCCQALKYSGLDAILLLVVHDCVQEVKLRTSKDIMQAVCDQGRMSFSSFLISH